MSAHVIWVEYLLQIQGSVFDPLVVYTTVTVCRLRDPVDSLWLGNNLYNPIGLVHCLDKISPLVLMCKRVNTYNILED